MSYLFVLNGKLSLKLIYLIALCMKTNSMKKVIKPIYVACEEKSISEFITLQRKTSKVFLIHMNVPLNIKL